MKKILKPVTRLGQLPAPASMLHDLEQALALRNEGQCLEATDEWVRNALGVHWKKWDTDWVYPSIKRTDASIPTEPAPPAVPLAPAPKKEVSRTLTLRFGLGSAKLSPAARTQLNEAMADLKSTRRITIFGRTDNTGPLAFNDSLALARALAVRDHLLKTHPRLTPALTIKAQGGCCFIAPNDTQVGRTKNRRVEVVFQMNEGLPP